MTFMANIPQTGQSLGQTRDAIRNNFTNYNNLVSQDHVSPNSTGQGKHNKSTYVVQSADPVTIANEIAEYSKAVAGIAQLFLIPASAGTPIQLSRLDKGISAAATGWTFLPGGIIVQWGSTGVVNGAFTTNYVARGGIAFTTNTFRVFLTVDDPGAPGNPITSFTVNSGLNLAASFSGTTNRSITLNYVAIGS